MLSRKQSSLGPLRLLLLIPLSLWVLNKITLKECDRQVNKPEELSENCLPPENAPPYHAKQLILCPQSLLSKVWGEQKEWVLEGGLSQNVSKHL